MLFDKGPMDALKSELLSIDTAQKRVSFLRAYLDHVIEEYARALNEVHIDELMKQYKARGENSASEAGVQRAVVIVSWLKPLPSAREILAMPTKEARKYQGLWRFKDGTVYISHDNRFLEGGEGMKFYRAWHDVAERHRKAAGDNWHKGDYFESLYEESERRFVEVENEVTTDEILEYDERVKSGAAAFRIGQSCFTKNLLLSHKLPMQLDGLEWPSIEHYMLAQQFEDVELREKIRTGRTLTEIRKMISKVPARKDWANVRDDFLRKA